MSTCSKAERYHSQMRDDSVSRAFFCGRVGAKRESRTASAGAEIAHLFLAFAGTMSGSLPSRSDAIAGYFAKSQRQSSPSTSTVLARHPGVIACEGRAAIAVVFGDGVQKRG